MLPLIVLIVFPFLIWGSYKKLSLSRASATWPQVPGVVTAAERVKRGWRTQPSVTYSYEVSGKAYSGNKITFADMVPSGETEPTLARYPVQQAVTVHFNPNDPGVAVLEPGPNRYVSGIFRYWIMLFVVVLLVNIANIALAAYKARQGASEHRTYGDSSDVGAPASGTPTPDLQLGNRLLRADADKGDATDQFYVGIWYLDGSNGYAKDPVEAMKWFRKSADQGNAQGELMVGQLYAKGAGVDKDLKTAVEWLEKSAAQGNKPACFNLGVATEKGLGGLQQDTQKAIEWYRKAGDDPHAKEALARLHAE